MQSNAAYKFAPLVSDDRKIDVSMSGGDTEIKLSGWVEGLGWCTQKTLKIEPEMLDELHRVIAAARIRLRSEQIEEAGNVLRFPN